MVGQPFFFYLTLLDIEFSRRNLHRRNIFLVEVDSSLKALREDKNFFLGKEVVYLDLLQVAVVLVMVVIEFKLEYTIEYYYATLNSTYSQGTLEFKLKIRTNKLQAPA